LTVNPVIDWPVVVIFLGTTMCSGICILVPFYLVSRSDRLTEALSRGSPIYLRFITVILVVWYASVLALRDQMNQGTSAIFGMIVGYVFGAINRQHPSEPQS
jgi:hypothetical protein